MQADVAILESRGVVHVHGEEAEHFLQNLVTCHVDTLTADHPSFGALLTPQGKILWDFLIFAAPNGGFFIDAPKAEVQNLVKRLSFYKLRSKVTIEDCTESHGVAVAWGASLPDGFVTDPRLASLGGRCIFSNAQKPAALEGALASEADWHQHRIRLGVPESILDFPLGDTFPHDVNMDSLNGVAFDKGCFVGQEVVSRMKHRGTARKRIVVVQGDTSLPPSGTEVTASGKVVGSMGSSAGENGLALLRLDRTKQALDAGDPITAEGATLRVSLPAWATFGWPD